MLSFFSLFLLPVITHTSLSHFFISSKLLTFGLSVQPSFLHFFVLGSVFTGTASHLRFQLFMFARLPSSFQCTGISRGALPA